ncbi:uncharacterized protein LOC116015844 [Ipomoea triloba]|uniref:uncharacterized protein LOC116015844 n=1 Tax=Ipomoea triloba TaxID=35885 RepID=UPI00125CE5C1|nr:uncharacterized protein LOC116015844 [Ipomoea triloba]
MVKTFLWRCMRHILPVREVLKSKGVSFGGGCPLCSSQYETISHILCECTVARQLWCCDDVLHGLSFVDFVESTLRDTDVELGVLMAVKFWVLWKVRNDAVWNSKQWQLADMRRYMGSLLSAWQEAWPTISSTGQAQLVRNNDWKPPPLGFLKCNVDAAIHSAGATFGAVLRNHEGLFVAALSGQLHCSQDPYLAEALAVKEALSWIKSRPKRRFFKERRFYMESDCLNFCSSFNSVRQDFSIVGLVTKQCRSIACDIGNVLVRHVNRSANQVAHMLARATGSSFVLRVWESARLVVFRIGFNIWYSFVCQKIIV